MVDKIKDFWHDQIPGWFPVFLAIIGCAFWIGQAQQSINDRLKNLEVQVMAIQDYLRSDHKKSEVEPPLPGISSNNNAPQDAGAGRTSW